MAYVRFAVHAVIVLSLVVFVGVSNHGRLTGASTRIAPDARQSSSALAAGAGTSLQPREGQIGYGSMFTQRASAVSAGAVHRKLLEDGIQTGRRDPGAVIQSLGARLNGIIGQARTTMNAPVPFARLVLRDPKTGRIEARAIADEQGLFAFLDTTPSAYVIEMLGPKDHVFATSDVITVAEGELREAVVRVADPKEALGLFGIIAPAAAEPIAVAATTGINAVAAPVRNVSPQQ